MGAGFLDLSLGLYVVWFGFVATRSGVQESLQVVFRGPDEVQVIKPSLAAFETSALPVVLLLWPYGPFFNVSGNPGATQDAQMAWPHG